MYFIDKIYLSVGAHDFPFNSVWAFVWLFLSKYKGAKVAGIVLASSKALMHEKVCHF